MPCSLVLSPEGRTSIPAIARAEAHVAGGVEMTVTVLGEGSILLETPEAVWERIHARMDFLGEVREVRTALDPVAIIRQMRNDDIALVDAKVARVLDPSYAATYEYPADTRTYASDEEMWRDLGIDGF
jgi:hypothetical protein